MAALSGWWFVRGVWGGGVYEPYRVAAEGQAEDTRTLYLQRCQDSVAKDGKWD